MSSVSRLKQILLQDMDYKTRRAFQRRLDTMLSTLNYLKASNNAKLKTVANKGWTVDRLEIVCCLVVFYQIVLGPLTSFGRIRLESGIGMQIPIQYGTLTPFDSKKANYAKELHNEFTQLVSSFGIGYWWLQATDMESLIFQIYKDTNGDNDD